ncbi:MAG: alkaline phosphatase family protein [Bacteroidales bacterium]|nr:alkaline phosphatase family protein [Bacteroidales bacterium]
MPRLLFTACALVAMVALPACFRTPPDASILASPSSAQARPDPNAEKPKPVRLMVVLMFDQMRGDYVQKWLPLFGDGGFRRLMTEGAWFANCHYPYATTTTGNGHASVLTGTSAASHGIINNSWYDRQEGATVNCSTLSKYSVVPPTPGKKAGASGTPDRLLSPNVADSLKTATQGKGKVFGLSLKDRSAIFPSGHHADGAYWFEQQFVTSTYYRDALPKWVTDFNASGEAEKYFDRDWTRFRSDIDYEKYAGPDDGLGEGSGTKQGKTFPHPMNGGDKKPGSGYYRALANSPFGSEVLLAFAKQCVTAEQLGQDDTPDLLCVSFSSNDLIGHTWGPDSHEVFDVTLRTDALIADLLRFLDAKVGKGEYAVVVTADHGVCPNPEVSTARGVKAQRIDMKALTAGAEQHLQETFGGMAKTTDGKKDRWFDAVSPPCFYLNPRLLAEKKLDADTVAESLAGWLRKQEIIERVYTRKQLLGPTPANWDEMDQRVKKSFHPARSGEITIVSKPYNVYWGGSSGTSHGTPHPYDTHVPLLAYGPGVRGGKKTEAVTPQHGATIAAHFLHVPLPKDCEYTLPKTLK